MRGLADTGDIDLRRSPAFPRCYGGRTAPAGRWRNEMARLLH